ncbi:heterokaryon incompatibility protein-domain-containing protein [Cladorrhinum samala]|uniref:Heterokaryon incompatibility protein-domain-containing protein n=1 Tax=Cladorrhinum samala TaxID=585594 RepID=A0AAV9HL91_9PEZI|nr:heterokaryon incompatibility protein-domain-containing protein [Cladorrhinum samala]
MANPYTALRREPCEIRLLDILPWTTDPSEEIQLQLYPTALAETGDYTCLSYTWGQPKPDYPVSLNGVEFRVRENLHSALFRLRCSDKPLRIWIDAVCINQDDIEEREFQVSIMRHVYSSAANVIAWIGEESGPADKRAVDFAREMAQRVAPWRDYKRLTPAGREVGPDLVKWIKSTTSKATVNSGWLDLLALISRPWFSRVWIIQEVVMGKEVVVHCGPHTLDWMQLFYCALFIVEENHLFQSIAAPYHCRFSEQLQQLGAAARNIHKVGRLFWDPTSTPASEAAPRKKLAIDAGYNSLWQLIGNFRTFNTTEERDRVYALLGLAERIDNIRGPLPTVSYDQDVRFKHVLLDVISTDLKANPKFEFLSQATGIGRQDGLPSWMALPHFDANDKIRILSMPRQFIPLEHERGVTPYRADGPRRPIGRASVDKESNTLNLLGRLAGIINLLSPTHDRGDRLKGPQCQSPDIPSNQYNARKQWAAIVGISDADQEHWSLYSEFQFDASRKESTKAKLKLLQSKRARADANLHQRFLGTLLMSGSDAGTEPVCFGSFIKPEAEQSLRAEQGGWLDPLHMRMAQTCHSRRFFTCYEVGTQGEILESTNFGLCPSNTQLGDIVAMFVGYSRSLHVIRYVRTDANGLPVFGYVGQAYVHNWMQGQLFEEMVVKVFPGGVEIQGSRQIKLI